MMPLLRFFAELKKWASCMLLRRHFLVRFFFNGCNDTLVTKIMGESGYQLRKPFRNGAHAMTGVANFFG